MMTAHVTRAQYWVSDKRAPSAVGVGLSAMENRLFCTN